MDVITRVTSSHAACMCRVRGRGAGSTVCTLHSTDVFPTGRGEESAFTSCVLITALLGAGEHIQPATRLAANCPATVGQHCTASSQALIVVFPDASVPGLDVGCRKDVLLF